MMRMAEPQHGHGLAGVARSEAASSGLGAGGAVSSSLRDREVVGLHATLQKRDGAKYHKIGCNGDEVDALLVDVFLEARKQPPRQIVLDLDATDIPLHGHQEGGFFHGYYDNYCYLPLYVFCGRDLLLAKLRRSNIDASAGAVEEIARIVAHIRRGWPRARIILRADSGFAREALMHWCEMNGVDYVFGLARTKRLEEAIAARAGRRPCRYSAEGAVMAAREVLDELLADKGYDANWFRARVAKAGADAVIPSTRSRSQAIPYDRHIYQERNLVEIDQS